MSDEIVVRKLSRRDAAKVRDLRLEGLRLFPANFGSSWEEEACQPLAWWESRLGGGAHWLGAEHQATLIGLTVVSLNQKMNLAHNADLGAMYVCERFHRQGVGSMLMQSAMEYLKNRALHATLTVNAENHDARRLYERWGFVVCGQLERGLSANGLFYDELLMRARIS
jgi:GNAT superfamily N-acetyltransferase